MTGSSVVSLAVRSLLARKVTALLTMLSIATAVMLFVAVENVRQGARDSFERTISGTDLIVGARSSPVNLILYTVFQLGDATNNVTWETYEQISSRSDVAWTVPFSLGDSHRGYRVIGTTPDYFQYYKYGDDRPLEFRSGEVFEDLFDIVIGAQVARDLGYEIGTDITLSHGVSETSFLEHADKPFTIKGILAPTGTPVDRSVLVSLPAIEAIHAGWQSGGPTPLANAMTPERLRELDLQPAEITAMFVGARSYNDLLRLHRTINTYRGEALQAVLPGVTLEQLWEMMSVVENALSIISAFVIGVGLIGILTSILTSLNERRREMAILRSVGARPRHIVGLLVSEAVLLAAAGAALGIAALYGASWALSGILETQYNISALTLAPGVFDLKVIGVVSLLAGLLGLLPALIALKRSVADGLTVRV